MSISLTPLERQALAELRRQLNVNEPEFSDIVAEDIADKLDWHYQRAYGVITSLERKGFVDWDSIKVTTDAGTFQFVYLTDLGWHWEPPKPKGGGSRGAGSTSAHGLTGGTAFQDAQTHTCKHCGAEYAMETPEENTCGLCYYVSKPE